jgi:hypothetical protein
MAKTLAELREMHKNMNSEEKKSGGSSNGFWSPEEGNNIVRFLPGKEDPLDFFAEVKLHAYQDEDGKWGYYKCRKIENEKCPMCELYYDLWKRHNAEGLGREDDSKFSDMARRIKPRPRYYSLAIIRDLEEKGEDPVKVISMSKQLFDRVMHTMVEPDFQDEDDPDNTTMISLDRGNDFNIRMTKQGQWPSYVESLGKYKKTPAAKNGSLIAEYMDTELNLQSLGGIDSYEKGKEIVMSLEGSLNPVKTESTPPWKDDGEELEV